jgi:hypothetical protein
LFGPIVGSLSYWASWILSGTHPPKHKAQRGEVLIMAGRGVVTAHYF